jgi:hypothetical protein
MVNSQWKKVIAQKLVGRKGEIKPKKRAPDRMEKLQSEALPVHLHRTYEYLS